MGISMRRTWTLLGVTLLWSLSTPAQEEPGEPVVDIGLHRETIGGVTVFASAAGQRMSTNSGLVTVAGIAGTTICTVGVPGGSVPYGDGKIVFARSGRTAISQFWKWRLLPRK